ncbi:hypothetical protein SARC_11623 [Sphaeroforma arctica JP610]|uniref:Phosphatidic acid phosphatase type 2/haloperoxidase domain-containing protein n=1 Tax=Sphaeroforma arctica JP610 TaxID=667725 RepID=A0A0L0FGF1_9EUKA|nr:hypothetical protein SARC_11623 [Sphaeroforma arctica JP610]KNC75859.1 hypothetical protein SARC_11623 [Sphaeroforma arctica JP610]|eukprot:XP_014149761.1 hypothetical protein SARC_11623 [Sphaeroforma arctica JP610]
MASSEDAYKEELHTTGFDLDTHCPTDEDYVETTITVPNLSLRRNSNGNKRDIKMSNVRQVIRCLKPVDLLVLTYLALTIPLVAYARIWGGIVVRILLLVGVVYGRWYLVQTRNQTSFTFRITNRSFQVSTQLIIGFLLDIYGLIACIYIYGEDGKVIAALYPDAAKDFYDNEMKAIDAGLFGNVKVEDGTGYYLRSLTGQTFNLIFGEWLHFCYFFYYIILVGTWLIAWAFIQHEHFDIISTVQVMVYLVCLVCYLVIPVAGPYWAYPDKRPEAEDVGFVFARVTHFLVEGGSSSGTAFPSGHCSMTTAALVLALLYIKPLGLVYLFTNPSLIFATVWCGFHYFIDAFVGVLVGLMCCALGHLMVRVVGYNLPAYDDRYSQDFRASKSAGGAFDRTRYSALDEDEEVEMDTPTEMEA